MTIDPFSTSRRVFLIGAAASGLAGCIAPPRQSAGVIADPAMPPVIGLYEAPGGTPDYATAYAAVQGEPFPIPAFRWTEMNPAFLRQDVVYVGREEPGTVVIDPKAHHLYHIAANGRAMRYGVGVGKEGFAWNGAATIRSKQQWPDWYPPKEMLERQHDLAAQMTTLQSGIGMHGGPRNPLGARAMYLWQDNKDTLYRIHGTVEPFTIGKSVSSGCIRMINQDVIHLFSQTPEGTKVVVLA